MNVEVEIKNGDLEMERYEFYFHETRKKLYLCRYARMKRQTKRHGWKSEGFYSSYDGRGSTIKLDDINLTEEIKRTAMEKFTAGISVEKWNKG